MLGFGPCHHFPEDLRRGTGARCRRWLDVIGGRPDWDAVFDGFHATVDTPACNYRRELADYYPDAKVVLTGDAIPISWFDSAQRDDLFRQAAGLAGRFADGRP